MYDCPICSGSGTIQLPVRQQLTTTKDNSQSISLPVKTYPCPECGKVVSTDHLFIVQAQELIDPRVESASRMDDYQDHCRKSIAHRIGRFLCDNGLIDFKTEKADRPYHWREHSLLRGKVGVVAPYKVASFEERVKERQMMIADMVVQDAIVSIKNWGARYNYQDIEKSCAIRFLYAALDKIKVSGPK